MKRFIDDAKTGLRVEIADRELNERLFLATFTCAIGGFAFFYILKRFDFAFDYPTTLIALFLTINFARFGILVAEKKYSTVGDPRTRTVIEVMSLCLAVLVGEMARTNLEFTPDINFYDEASMLTLAAYAALSSMTFASKPWLATAHITFVLGIPILSCFTREDSLYHIIAVLLSIYYAALNLHIRLLHKQFIQITSLSEKARVAAITETANQQLNLFFQENPFPMHIMGADGVVRMVNRAWADLWGLNEDQIRNLVGRLNLLRDMGVNQQDSLTNLSRVLKGERLSTDAVVVDPRLITGFGRARWVERYYNPIVENGQVSSVLVMYRDVTAERQAEQAIEISNFERAQAVVREQTAVEASKMKTEFLANMSHEIRTPINGVLGMIGFLRDSVLSPEQREYAEAAHRSAQGLLTVINDILDLSKVEAGKLELEALDFSMSEIVNDAAHVFTILSEQKSLRFHVHVDERLKAPLFGDANRIRQILNNLLSNAVKFTEKGSIQVRVDQTQSTDHEVSFRLSVKDTGLGISDSLQTRLFKAFEQANSSTSRRFGGTGLGLAISKNLVELMNGTIEFTSKEGAGTEFSVALTLPRGRTVSSSAGASADAFQICKGARILIAEDNKINQVITRKVLESLGFLCEIAEDGFGVLAALERREFDLILMDCQMPGMDGFEATVQIRSQESTYSEIPIVGFTAGAMKADRDRCLESGMTDYLSKPADKAALARKLAPILERARGQSRAS